MPNWFPYPLLSFDKFIKLCYCKLHVGPAARFVKNCCEREPGTVTNPLNDLNWHSLELRRKIARLTTMYKIVNNKTRVNIPEYIARSTRVKRSYHRSKFINIGSNSDTSKYNFFTRTLKEWNTLPSFLSDQPSLDAFKSALTNYFNLPHWFYTSFYCIIYLFIIIVIIIIIIYDYHYYYFFI